ncbi:pre-mRNA-splicing factor ATP-dependent RNA helicase PRP16 [Histomonas meleagridis]|uniref:pre-mRNA-splicing factor ATP-dependent RNA helicase PRP16 n=1 Tax=Histomonas meleagridis TaxID=135588 RepID=UPI00355A7287|nr:pre-mRNA-splicing factor ATP-dependent RNA helicase PRP16 [Histomonas meleagridis]KAH0801904.1 pre-mRNA-splicing factor ATP-dependent RNA helicase PRP16 [Histomonas meleagridis]
MSDDGGDDDFAMERSWYDEEEGMVVDIEDNRRLFAETEGLNLTPSAALQKKIDVNKWEDLLIEQAGVSTERHVQNLDDEEIETKVYLSVNSSRPAFLSNYDSSQFHQPKPENRFTVEGDLYQLAKNGSRSVVEWRKHHEQRAEMKDLISSERESKIRKAKQMMLMIRSQGTSQYKDLLTTTGNVNKTALPIYQSRNEILRLVSENNVIIIVGETGSGKTTQITQYLHEEGYSKFGQIVCTQPRRVAAVSVAKRVADEMGVTLGEEVGYTIRFEEVSSPKTVIRYMTDGILLRESLVDPLLEKYSVIIMDEAHERSLNTDVLFGVLKQVLSKRHDIRVIVTSATMDSQKFSRYFGGAPILNVSGRTYNVELSYMRSNPEDYVATAVTHIFKVHLTEPPGDILVFMTGQDDVECTCEMIRQKLDEHEEAPPLEVLPIYSQLPADLQARVFEPMTIRKCVVATNIAETSLTINGIRYVIDCGFAKQKSYSSKAGLDTLLVQPISQAAAIQRAGRAGRTMDGKCWRLYTEMSFNFEMTPMTIPEIQRTNLSNVILLLKSMGFNDVLSFDFMDRPPLDNFMHALTQLWSLRALDNEGNLTQMGRDMVMFPLDPTLSKMLLMGNKLHCLSEILTIVSMLSVPPVFFKPKGKEEEADSMKEKFLIPESDHLTLLNVFNIWSSIGKTASSERDREIERASWSRKHFLHNVSLIKANEVRKQLIDIAKEAKLEITSCKDWTIVRKAICSAYFHQAARLQGLNEYVNLHTGVKCYLHPSSSLAGLGYVPEYIVYHELVLTSKHFIHGVTAVDPLWLSQMAPEFFTATDAFGNVLEEGKPPMDEINESEKNKVENVGNENVEKEQKIQKMPQVFLQTYDDEKVIMPPSASTIRKRRKMK